MSGLNTSGGRSFRLNRSQEELTPLPWHAYFKNKRTVEIDGNKFTMYSMGKINSVLIVLLHGGGFNALTWAIFAVSILKTYRENTQTYLMCYHTNFTRLPVGSIF